MKNVKENFETFLKENAKKENFLSLLKERACEIAHKEIEGISDFDKRREKLYEIFEELKGVLKDNDLLNIKALSSLISAMVEALTLEEKKKLYDLMNEKELLEKRIEDKKEDIREKIVKAFEIVENKAKEEDEEIVVNALNNVKLQSMELLGILRETAQEAILGAIEKGDDIEESIEEIVKNIVYEAINEGELTKKRIIYIVKTVIDASVEIADEDQAFAKEILKGSVYGSKKGVSKAIGKFKNELKLIPNEVQKEIASQLEKTKNELYGIDEDFINILRESALSSKGISKEILNEIILKLNSAVEKLKKKSLETREAIMEKLKEIKPEGVFEKEIIHEAKQFSEDAKKVGRYLLDITKGILNGAIKGAKDAIKK